MQQHVGMMWHIDINPAYNTYMFLIVCKIKQTKNVALSKHNK